MTIIAHKTTIAYQISLIQSKEGVIEDLQNLKQYIINKYDDWGFELQMDGKIINGEECGLIFDDFINFINENTHHGDLDSGNEGLIFSKLGKYEADLGSPELTGGPLEDGNFEFSKSIVILPDGEFISNKGCEFTLLIQVNVPGFYANDVSPNDEGLGIEAEAIDVNGYYFEFQI
jgi:hypothetical protein|tara:strand:+ start:1679 stop:2203 length:525 start_codon:yes stop_codon:yes gene_type:complete